MLYVRYCLETAFQPCLLSLQFWLSRCAGIGNYWYFCSLILYAETTRTWWWSVTRNCAMPALIKLTVLFTVNEIATSLPLLMCVFHSLENKVWIRLFVQFYNFWGNHSTEIVIQKTQNHVYLLLCELCLSLSREKVKVFFLEQLPYYKRNVWDFL